MAENPAYDADDGPPLMVLTGWAHLLHQSLHGYRDPKALFGKHHRTVSRRIAALQAAMGKSPQSISLAPSAKTAAELKKWRLATLADRNGNKLYCEPFEDTKARVERAGVPPGPLSAFFMGLPERQEESLPHTRKLAGELDELSNLLVSKQMDGKDGSLEDYKRVLLGSPLVAREDWTIPGQDQDCLSLFKSASDWPTAWMMTSVVIFHQQIAVLAL